METKCPYCDRGCDKCTGGFFESALGDGPVFAEHCTFDSCGFVNGIWVVRKGQPLPTDERRCALCHWKTEWELFGWSAPDPGHADGEDPNMSS